MFDQKIDESVFESELLRSCEQQQPFWCLSTRFLLPNKHKKKRRSDDWTKKAVTILSGCGRTRLPPWWVSVLQKAASGHVHTLVGRLCQRQNNQTYNTDHGWIGVAR